MARTDKTPSRMEILVLSSLARQPMHGYDIKLEFQYKHVRWWAKAEHGHIYAALARMEKNGLIVRVGDEQEGRRRKVYAITEAGRARLEVDLRTVGRAPDATTFDIDLFISGSFLMELDEVLEVLAERLGVLEEQLSAARTLKEGMSPYIPASGHLIIEHRIDHLELEVAYVRKVSEAFRAQATWGSFLGRRRISDFVQQTGVDLEADGP